MTRSVSGQKVVPVHLDNRTVSTENIAKMSEMLPLYQDPCFTFQFADDPIIPRFHLEGVEAGRRVLVFKIDPATGERLNLLATAMAGQSGWVELVEPIIVKAGEAFVAVPE
jgi:hypothetical protein